MEPREAAVRVDLPAHRAFLDEFEFTLDLLLHTLESKLNETGTQRHRFPHFDCHTLSYNINLQFLLYDILHFWLAISSFRLKNSYQPYSKTF